MTIEESKDLDEIKIQELIGSLQTYELGLPSHKSNKSLALKTINERMAKCILIHEKIERFLIKKGFLFCGVSGLNTLCRGCSSHIIFCWAVVF